MPLPYRPLFRYGENVAVFLDLPITPWVRHTGVIGGDIEADSGARAAYVVRRDEFITFSLRFWEREWPYVQLLIDYAQAGNLIVWYPDREDLNTPFPCYLEAPAVGSPYSPTPDGQYPRVLMLEITLARGSWPLPSWNSVDETPPAGPTGWVIHYFTHGGIFTVLAGSGNAEILIVGAGGSGGSVDGSGVGAGGGGAGGVIHRPAEFISAGVYDVAVGTGASGPHVDHTLGGGGLGVAPGNDGGDSSFGDFLAKGGGGGGGGINVPNDQPARKGRDGASGGGGASSHDPFNTAPDNHDGGTALYGPQGSDGGGGVDDEDSVGGGGGGAGGSGSLGTGGAGALFDIASPDGTMAEYAHGGAAVGSTPVNATGYGQGGQGGRGAFGIGGSGGGGVVIVKYPIESGIVATGGIRVEYPT